MDIPGFRRPLTAAAGLLAGLPLIALMGSAALAATGSKRPQPAVERVQAAASVPSAAHSLGQVPTATPETGAVVLSPRDPDALTKFIGQVTTKDSPFFHQYLAPGQFGTRFGPTQSTIEAVKRVLIVGGLRVTSVANDGMLVSFSGSAAQVEHAFSTSLTRYRLADGSNGQATTGAVVLPASVASSVSAVVGLNDLVRAQPAGLVHHSGATSAHGATARSFAHPTGSPTACADASAAAEENGGLSDDQIANAYGGFGLYGSGDTGAGQGVAIFELEPFLPSDATTFDTCYFGGSAASAMAGRLSVVPVDGGQPTGGGSGESILDVEDVSAIAPGATIRVYEAPNSTFGALDDYATIINNDTERVVSTSWGNCEQALQEGSPGQQQAENALFEQAAAQGQSIFSAAGDEGSDDCDAFEVPAPVPGQNPISVDDPGTQPYVVSVGGTTIDDATQPPSEHVWNDGSAFGAGGGGISQTWAMPSWQQSARVPGTFGPGSADYNAANAMETRFGYPTGFCQGAGSPDSACRLVPDVSAQADEFTGAVTVYGEPFATTSVNEWTTIGGTSSSAPLWVAFLTLVDASPTCADNPTTAQGVGFVSPLLYGVASNPTAYAASFNDVTVGNDDIFGLDNGQVFPATTGYDLASGLGSPALTSPSGGPGLAFYLCTYGGQASRPQVSGLSPAILSTAGGTVTVTGTGFESGTTPDVAGITVGNARVAPGSFTVTSPTTITATLPPASATLAPGSPAPQDGAGRAEVTVTISDGETSAPGAASALQYVDDSSGLVAPSITGLSPSAGSESGSSPVTVLGSGFTGTTEVTFGGVPGTNLSVLSPYELRVTPPAYGTQACGPSAPGQSPATDVCQVQVQVTNAQGTSIEGPIAEPFEGLINFNQDGSEVLPPGCQCESAPGPSEFDYVPQPKVTSVSTAAGPASFASEFGGSLVTITGSGFDPLAFDWIDVGDPAQESSMTGPVVQSGTAIEFLAAGIISPPDQPTLQPETFPLSVRSLVGQSNSRSLTYAGVPVVTKVTDPALHAAGAPDTGGSPLTITGKGFTDVSGPLIFADDAGPYSVGSQYTYSVVSGSKITATTVQQNPALLDILVCTVTGCSPTSSADLLYEFPPGNPKVDSVTPSGGPATGGTSVAIGGQNLGCVTGVFFGSVSAVTFSNSQAVLDCGSTDLVTVTAPPGKAGTTVPVTVTTVESDLTGSGSSTTAAPFTYGPLLVATSEPPASVRAGSTFSVAFSIENPPSGVVTNGHTSVTLAITSGSGTPGAALRCLSNPAISSSGVVDFSCSINRAGAGYTLTASGPGVASGVSTALAVAPTKLAFTAGPPTSVAANAPFAVTVAVEDPTNGVSSTSAVPVTLALTPGAGPAGATLTCPSDPVTSAEGKAKFSCSLNKAGGGYSLSATSPGLANAASTSFNVRPA